ncbi:MAG: PQQ-binding-like beta-propeller repeat protein [Carbonactinosporaceae bacterium]
MELTNRAVRIIYHDGLGLLVTDNAGRVHLLDDQLEVVRSSPVVSGGRPTYAVAVAGRWIVGKDLVGNIVRWSLDTLDLVDYLDAAATCDRATLLDGEEPSPVVNRGIAVWQNRVFVNNGYMQLLVLDLETFAIERIVPSVSGDVPIEWICTEHPQIHAVSDKEGHLFLGRLDSLDFPTVVEVDSKANLHRVRYDPRHDRFWVTQDSGDGEHADIANGVVIVHPDGTVADQLRFARDDVEFIEFSAGYRRAYVGGFDGMLQVFDNSAPELRVERTAGPFSHQLSDLAIGAGGQLYALSQDGEIVRLDPDGTPRARAPFRRQCVWDIQPAVEDPRRLYCATDDGVAVVQVDDTPYGPHLQPVGHHVSGYGFTRRVAAAPGGWIGITRDGLVYRADADGRRRWTHDLGCLPHTVAGSPDHSRALVSTNEGGVELDAATGEPVDRLGIDDLPLWACAYLPTGERVLATRNGLVCAFGADSGELWRSDLGGYPKRMRYERGALFVTGEHGVKEMAADGSGLRRSWSELVSNTCENVALLDGLVCAVSYSGQLLTYDYASGELLDLVEGLPDFPKGLTVLRGTGQPHLVVGGRGGYLITLRPDKGVFTRVRDTYLPRPGFRAAGPGNGR